MAKKIYKLFLGKGNEAWHQLSAEEQESLFAKVDEARDEAGGKEVISCDSSWSTEQWPFFGVEEFPNIEAVQKHSELLEKLNWLRYVETMTVLGTEWETT